MTSDCPVSSGCPAACYRSTIMGPFGTAHGPGVGVYSNAFRRSS